MTQAALMEKTTADVAQNFEFMIGGLPGRIEPLHDGHVGNVRAALKRAKYLVFLVGSSNLARSYKNPLTYEERKLLIEQCFPAEVAEGRLIIRPMPDFFRDHEGWAENTKRIVREVAAEIGVREGIEIDDSMIGLAGFRKDAATSEYLDMFPEWGDIMLTERVSKVDATAIREAYFRRDSVILAEYLPAPVVAFLERFRLNPAYAILVRERENIDHIREVYNKDDPQNYTGDILVMHRGQFLMTRRGGDYGHDLWAFPGGIRDAGEDFLDCSLREVDEESGLTRLNPWLTIDILKSNVVMEYYNDTPGRDLRGRYATMLYVIVLPDWMEVPKVEPMDDAKHAEFVDPALIPETLWFCDHHGMYGVAIQRLKEMGLIQAG
ncbi:NUDIX domain-containing protein [Rhizobium sp. BK176]|uniref:NUDIX domain-containing protein n=1 Tax=Rhizobium sp. BK176 TaxID=2587071 RepID=UPI002169DF90|nr:NUDIX domain-containing protein [Rhizobium sp. BK176]MCS4088821.1 bifunctional NMN adenylyltransferase/nudix hydrolase [Rhizobium sp. BK176]